MTTPNPLHPLSPQEWAALIDAAKVRAVELRHEAIDDFWRDAHAVLQRSLQGGIAGAARAARRLQARLARHRLHRGASALGD